MKATKREHTYPNQKGNIEKLLRLLSTWIKILTLNFCSEDLFVVVALVECDLFLLSLANKIKPCESKTIERVEINSLLKFQTEPFQIFRNPNSKSPQNRTHTHSGYWICTISVCVCACVYVCRCEFECRKRLHIFTSFQITSTFKPCKYCVSCETEQINKRQIW